MVFTNSMHKYHIAAVGLEIGENNEKEIDLN